MSIKDLTKTEKKIRWETGKMKRNFLIGCFVSIVLLLGLCAMALLSSCTIKMVPAGSVQQAELLRRNTISSFKDGILFGVMLGTESNEIEEPDLIHPYLREEE